MVPLGRHFQVQMDARICSAISGRLVLEFDYGDDRRIVHPYCHGLTRARVETLRAVQVGGTSRSQGFGFGKLWTVSKIRGLRVTDEVFVPDDPDYNPDDVAMVEIHCRI
jgi:hypothetical protein